MKSPIFIVPKINKLIKCCTQFSDELNYYRPNRQRFNKLLAAYLRRDDDIDPESDDPSEFQARKRSFFRERDGT